MSNERTVAERVGGTAALVAGGAWFVGALLFVDGPYSTTPAGSVAFVASAVLPPVVAVVWSRRGWSHARWADGALAAAAVLLIPSFLFGRVIGPWPWTDLMFFTFLVVGPTVVWVAWKRPGNILTGAAFPVSFVLAVFLDAARNLLAVVLLACSVIIGLAWLPMAWRRLADRWAEKAPNG